MEVSSASRVRMELTSRRSNPRHIVPSAKHPTTNVIIPAQATRTSDPYCRLSNNRPSRRLVPARQIPNMGPPYPDQQARKQGRRKDRAARGRKRGTISECRSSGRVSTDCWGCAGTGACVGDFEGWRGCGDQPGWGVVHLGESGGQDRGGGRGRDVY
jgi:hypothetical protein